MVATLFVQEPAIELVLHRRETDVQHILLLRRKAFRQNTVVTALSVCVYTGMTA